MHVVSKKNGKQQRVVDLKSVNAAACRKRLYVEPPFAQASSIPPGTVLFTLETVSRYHSVPLDPCNHHIMAFIIQWGRLK